jgi:hypothetical protein
MECYAACDPRIHALEVMTTSDNRVVRENAYTIHMRDGL